jgi:hypothetical protein
MLKLDTIKDAFQDLDEEEFVAECIETYQESDDDELRDACLAFLYFFAPDCDVPELDEQFPEDPRIQELIIHAKNLALVETLQEEIASFEAEHPATNKLELLKFIALNDGFGAMLPQLVDMKNHYQEEVTAVYQTAEKLLKEENFNRFMTEQEDDTPHKQLLLTGTLERLGFEIEADDDFTDEDED